MVWNPGVSVVGGFLQAHKELVRWVLAAFSVTVAAILAMWVRRAERPLFAVAIGLVIGGAVGNVIDRIRFGAVADFIDVSRLLYFPWIFNVADSAHHRRHPPSSGRHAAARRQGARKAGLRRMRLNASLAGPRVCAIHVPFWPGRPLELPIS